MDIIGWGAFGVLINSHYNYCISFCCWDILSENRTPKIDCTSCFYFTGESLVIGYSL